MSNKKENVKVIAGGIVMVAMVSLANDIAEFLSDYPVWLQWGVAIGSLLLVFWFAITLTDPD